MGEIPNWPEWRFYCIHEDAPDDASEPAHFLAHPDVAIRIPNDHYLIIDLEATCCNDGSFPREEMEIIEIGALMQSTQTFEIESEFQTFVKPVRHPQLTRGLDDAKNIARIVCQINASM